MDTKEAVIDGEEMGRLFKGIGTTLKESDNRYFQGGAYRDTSEEKFEYDGFLHPLVVEKFAEYMHKHRLQSDGKLRDSDNWWTLFGENHKDVCMQSGFRHFMDWWKEHRGFESRDGIDEALGGLIFNIQAYWLKTILERMENKDITKKD